jgi:hypothetical protein
MTRTIRCLTFIGIVALTATGCATAVSPSACARDSTPIIARAPANFGQVLDKDGRPTGVYRGGKLTSCNQVAFLRAEGITRILQLDAPKSDDVRREGDFEVLPLAFSAFTIGTHHTCDDVRTAVRFLTDRDNARVYVHCTLGRDRTGYVIGMFERMGLARDIDSVVAELASYGHSGLWSALFSQIDRELARSHPRCE